MLRRRRHLPLILAAALLAGQWVAAAHASEHGLQPAPHACAACVYAQDAGTGALTAPPRVSLEQPAYIPAAIAVGGPRAVSLYLHPIRGPPRLLA